MLSHPAAVTTNRTHSVVTVCFEKRGLRSVSILGTDKVMRIPVDTHTVD